MGGKSLRDFLAYFLKISVQIVHDGSAKHHPVITTNVLKNIIGDDVDHPSEILLNSAVTTITGMAKRDDDERILNQASSEGFGETAFISDLWNLFEIGAYIGSSLNAKSDVNITGAWLLEESCASGTVPEAEDSFGFH